MDEKREYLGRDEKGFRYYLDRSNMYVYQQYPEEFWMDGHNFGGEWVGWICHSDIWHGSFEQILVKEKEGDCIKV